MEKPSQFTTVGRRDETMIEREGLEVDFQTGTELLAEATMTEIETVVVTGRREVTLIMLVTP